MNLRRSIKRIFDKSIKKSSIYRILKKNKITFKRVSVDYSPYNKIEKNKRNQKLKQELNIIDENSDSSNVISYDESFMSPKTLIREYGWSKQGTKTIRNINGKTYRKGKSMLMAISNKKTVAHKLIAGSVKGSDVCNFIMNNVIGNNTCFVKTLFMDNAKSHYNKKLKEEMERTGNKIVYNVPYSPQQNPIEYLNNVVKGKLKAHNIENITGLENKLEKIINKIPESVYANCFKKAYRCITTD